MIKLIHVHIADQEPENVWLLFSSKYEKQWIKFQGC